MPNIPFHHPLNCPPIGAAGDVIAARRWAETSIARAPSPIDNRVLATLLLTAVCLHVDAEEYGNDRRHEIARCLEELAQGELDVACLTASPMQFVRYAAAELAWVGVLDRATLLRTLCGLLRPEDPVGSARRPSTGDSHGTSRNDNKSA